MPKLKEGYYTVKYLLVFIWYDWHTSYVYMISIDYCIIIYNDHFVMYYPLTIFFLLQENLYFFIFFYVNSFNFFFSLFLNVRIYWLFYLKLFMSHSTIMNLKMFICNKQYWKKKTTSYCLNILYLSVFYNFLQVISKSRKIVEKNCT